MKSIVLLKRLVCRRSQTVHSLSFDTKHCVPEYLLSLEVPVQPKTFTRFHYRCYNKRFYYPLSVFL